MNLMWLHRRLQEVRKENPEATLIDGFGYALAYIERNKSREQMAEPLLDRTRKYIVWTPDECWWQFKWECHTDQNGTRWYWQAYRKRPGAAAFTALDRWGELEVLQRLTEFSHGLDQDDKIDLMNFLHRGGIEQFFKDAKLVY